MLLSYQTLVSLPSQTPSVPTIQSIVEAQPKNHMSIVQSKVAKDLVDVEDEVPH